VLALPVHLAPRIVDVRAVREEEMRAPLDLVRGGDLPVLGDHGPVPALVEHFRQTLVIETVHFLRRREDLVSE
jgi:hypothetical protein